MGVRKPHSSALSHLLTRSLDVCESLNRSTWSPRLSRARALGWMQKPKCNASLFPSAPVTAADSRHVDLRHRFHAWQACVHNACARLFASTPRSLTQESCDGRSQALDVALEAVLDPLSVEPCVLGPVADRKKLRGVQRAEAWVPQRGPETRNFSIHVAQQLWIPNESMGTSRKRLL